MVKIDKICAFCSNWFEWGCYTIKLKNGEFLYYETDARKKCLKKRLGIVVQIFKVSYKAIRLWGVRRISFGGKTSLEEEGHVNKMCK